MSWIIQPCTRITLNLMNLKHQFPTKTCKVPEGVDRTKELLDFLRDEGPFDVVVADFVTSSGFQAAEELKIPCILNVPGEEWV